MRKLIIAYLEGYAGEEGRSQGMSMLHTRAAEKDVEAANMLAEFYLYGRSVSRDYYKAMQYYRIAAEGGSAQAHAMLARASLLGYGVDPSTEQADLHWQKAAQGGDPFAQFRETFDPKKAGLQS